MEDTTIGQLIDYKVHNFNGEPKLILVCKDRFEETGITEDFYSVDWEHLNISRPHTLHSETEIDKPTELEEMLEISRILSKGHPFLRTDFYIVNHHLYIGELTLFPASGFLKFIPNESDYTLGNLLEIPQDIKTSVNDL